MQQGRLFRRSLVFAILLVAASSLHATDWPELLRQAALRQHEQRQVPATGVLLVDAGKPTATIVCAEDDKAAAQMLNRWLERMSGATLPVATEAPATGAAVYLGAAAVAAGLDLSAIASSTREGIRLRSDGRNVMIGWQSNRAATRAVGRFLEEAFGCRYLSTQAWGMSYPTLATLRVRELEVSEQPQASFRRIWGAEGAFRNAEWIDWNGQGGRGLPMAHAWNFLTKEDFAAHPEWFRMDEKGERVYGVWPNFGNDEVRRKFIAKAVEDSQGGTQSISLSPPDSYQFDHSPEAKKYDNPDVIVSSTGWVSMTDRFMGIVNEAATAIHALGQESVVSFYAYSDYTMPPTKPELQKLSPNICVWIAPIRYSRYHPIGHPNSASRQELRAIVEGWSSCASMLGYRTYNYNLAELLTPFSKLSIWTHDLPYLHRKGCIGYNLESMDSWELSGPHLYLSIRLAYDPTLSPEEIIADYLVAAYGPAASAMHAYWYTLDDAWVNQPGEAGSIHALPPVFTPELLSRLDQALKQAEKLAAASPEHLAHVQLARRGWQRAVYWRQWFDAINAGEVARAVAIYDEWTAFVRDTDKRHDGNTYELTYLNRFVNGITRAAAAALQPEGGPARKVIAVLPDRWKFATGDYASTWPVGVNPWDVNLADEAWPTVATWSATLSAQGYPDYFGDMWYRTTVDVPPATGPLYLHVVKADRKVTAYVNGKQVNAEEQEAFRGTTIDVSGFVEPGQPNQITLKVRHIPLPELFLGGLIAPVYLIEGQR